MSDDLESAKKSIYGSVRESFGEVFDIGEKEFDNVFRKEATKKDFKTVSKKIWRKLEDRNI